MALTTLAKLKQYGGIEEFEADTLLLRMIDAASEFIESYCSRKFANEARTEVRDGTGTRKMAMRHYPITAVASVKINGLAVPARTSPLASGYTFDDYTIRLTGLEFDEGVDNVEITYTAGVTTVPAAVEQACCEMVMLRYKARDRIGVSSKSLAGETISFRSDDAPGYVLRSLDQYAMVGLP